MKVKKIIKTLSIIIVSVLTMLSFASCEALSFGNEGEFVKLRNIPKHERIFTYFSPTEIFYPGELHYKDNSSKERTLSTAKIYNIKTQKLTDLGVKMNIARTQPYCLRLNDGRILVFGGYDNRNNDIQKAHILIAEIYNPTTNQFEIIGKTNFSYVFVNIKEITLDDGRVLLIGKNFSMEVFNPKTNVFGLANKWTNIKDISKVTKLSDGRIYISGYTKKHTSNSLAVKSAEIYNPLTNEINISNTSLGDYAETVLLRGDKLYAYNKYIYDICADKITQLKESGPRGKWGGEMFPLSDNKVLIFGISYPTLASVLFDYNVHKYIEIYDPENDTYKKLSKNILFYKAIPMGNDTFFITTNDSSKPYAYLYKYKSKK